MIRLEIELTEAAFGTTKDIQVDNRGHLRTCNGEGTAPGTTMQTCDMCSGHGEVSMYSILPQQPVVAACRNATDSHSGATRARSARQRPSQGPRT